MCNFSERLDFLFPDQRIHAREWSIRDQVVVFVLLAIMSYWVGSSFLADGVSGYDWLNFFSQGRIPPYYPPWTRYVSLLDWPMMFGLSMAAVGLSIAKRSVHPVSALLALVSLPVCWTMYLGQLDGLAVLGLLGLPWLAPLALLKPQVSFFAFGARRSHVLGGVAWIVISILIWGFWPERMFAVYSLSLIHI